MIPTLLLDTAPAPDPGKELRLYQHDADFSIKLGNVELMNSRMHGSEEELARLACREILNRPAPQILIGGLGMGFTLRAALDMLPSEAQITVAELIPAVVKWNQGVLSALAGHPLRDERVKIHEGDVRKMIKAGKGEYDAILLDVDNGPKRLFQEDNNRLYSLKGLYVARTALRPRGILGIWSSGPDIDFTQRLYSAGFEVAEVRVNARAGRKAGGHHLIWLARR